MVSTFRRNVQSDLTDRLIAIANGRASMSRTVRQLAQFHLEQLNTRLDAVMKAAKADNVDAYSLAHVSDMQKRVQKALDAVYVAQ
jgi:predicted solute-binding protein